MAKKDIFKIDNYIITIGVIFTIFGGFASLGSFLQTNNIQAGGAFFLLSGLAMLVFGITVRKKENKIISIWDAVEKTGEIKINELSASLGLTRDFILSNLKHINNQRDVFIKYDTINDKLINGSLSKRVSIDVKCYGCGNSISESISIHSNKEVNCSYCGNPVSLVEVNKFRNEILSQNSTTTNIDAPQNDFNKTIFIALLFFCWPGAIAYYVIKRK